VKTRTYRENYKRLAWPHCGKERTELLSRSHKKELLGSQVPDLGEATKRPAKIVLSAPYKKCGVRVIKFDRKCPEKGFATNFRKRRRRGKKC